MPSLLPHCQGDGQRRSRPMQHRCCVRIPPPSPGRYHETDDGCARIDRPAPQRGGVAKKVSGRRGATDLNFSTPVTATTGFGEKKEEGGVRAEGKGEAARAVCLIFLQHICCYLLALLPLLRCYPWLRTGFVCLPHTCTQNRPCTQRAVAQKEHAAECPSRLSPGGFVRGATFLSGSGYGVWNVDGERA